MNAPSMIWHCIEPGRVDYREALEIQHRIVRAKTSDRSVSDIVLLLEHPSVFTLGRRGGKQNLTVSGSFLRARSIPIIPTERGGDITYHGPGQLVVYPLIDLAADGIKVQAFVERLETVMLRSLREWGIPGKRRNVNRGVWVGERKIGSIGIAIQRAVCFHGFALNVNLPLEPFKWIKPCGLDGVTMTSMQEEMTRPVSLASVTDTVKRYITEVFAVRLDPLPLTAITEIITGNREVA